MTRREMPELPMNGQERARQGLDLLQPLRTPGPDLRRRRIA